jgi:hypothetical protein
VQQHEPVAAVGLFQNVSGQQDGDAFLLAEAFDVAREVAPRRRVEPGGSLVHQQDLRTMQQRLGNFDAPAQSSGERLDEIVPAVRQSEALHRAINALPQDAPAQPVQMSLGSKVLSDRERTIQALRLEHDAHVAAHAGGVAHHITPGDERAPSARDHHGRKYSEQRGLPAPIRPQQAEDFALLHFEADIRKREAVAIAMSQVLDKNHKPGLSSSINP